MQSDLSSDVEKHWGASSGGLNSPRSDLGDLLFIIIMGRLTERGRGSNQGWDWFIELEHHTFLLEDKTPEPRKKGDLLIIYYSQDQITSEDLIRVTTFSRESKVVL